MHSHTYRIFYKELPRTPGHPEGNKIDSQEQKEMALEGFATPFLSILCKADQNAKMDGPPIKINSETYEFTVHTELEKTRVDELVDIAAKQNKVFRDELFSIQWFSKDMADIAKHLRCPQCHSSLIKPVDPSVQSYLLEFLCTACDKTTSLEDMAEDAINEWCAASAYTHHDAANGETSPVDSCHECDRETFLIGDGQCFACGAELEFESCSICERELSPQEQELGGLCDYHHNQLTKED